MFKMKLFYIVFSTFSSLILFSQEPISDKFEKFKNCKTIHCKTTQSLALSEYYLEIDKIEDSQKWLNVTKKMLLKQPNDSLQYISNSIQSELFYYMGLYQFGLHEAQKTIETAKTIGDSLFTSNAFLLEGINLFEMGNLSKSEVSFQKAKKYFPSTTDSTQKRFKINKEYIYNDIAQLKIKIKQLDSAYLYNKKAYKFAVNLKDNRCIANVERTFGELFMKQTKIDSAHYYFKKSIETSLNATIYDTALLGYGNLIELFSTQPEQAKIYFSKGQNLIEKHQVNLAVQKLFYAQSLKIFTSLGDKNSLLTVQKALLLIENNINESGNFYIQNITNQYINSENKLLVSKINELDKQKNIKRLQLIAALFFALILMLVIIIIRRKNKLQKSLLIQKNEISKDLHDDIGSELSSILINTNLLNNYDTNENQKILIDKISHTSSEISQRLNTFIWSLNTDNNNVQNFCEYVNQYAHKFLEGTAFKLNFVTDTQAVSAKILNGSLRKNLFFCVKEILNNIVKHSDATKIDIKIIDRDKKEFEISIADNGKGMQEKNKFGNGLINIKKRVANLNGNLKINSDNGLKIVIKIPY